MPAIKHILLLILTLFTIWSLSAQVKIDAVSVDIKLNQLGFYPNGPKKAIITRGLDVTHFKLIDKETGKIVFSDKLSGLQRSGYSSAVTRTADFSRFTIPGKYAVYIVGKGYSYPFLIQDKVYKNLGIAVVKAFYYQRCSTELTEEFAGKWARAKGHPDTAIIIHPSAVDKNNRAGSAISSPGGWYDAGDYNKYIVNSGITMGTLLSLYEDFPADTKSLQTHIPESNNAIPDLLDEVLWNLRWMLTMQDTDDGGVYAKLTNAAFDAMVMPGAANAPRYVVQKSTASTLNFAAVMAQAARIYKSYTNTLPGLADSCLRASEKAWIWAMKNPSIEYDQQKMNSRYLPVITTGAYEDRNFNDEFIWAACELFLSTENNQYYQAVNIFPDNQVQLPSWAQVRLLGYYSLARFANKLPAKALKDISELKKKIIRLADSLVKNGHGQYFNTVMGSAASDFKWGSNSVAANQAISLIQAYKLTSNPVYLNYASANLDYLLGRNATGYSFVTGYGYQTPRHPHHRPSVADDIKEPFPGLLVGGPNPGLQDDIHYPSAIPNEAYLDNDGAYSVNEIAINWNAAMAYLVNAIEFLQKDL